MIQYWMKKIKDITLPIKAETAYLSLLNKIRTVTFHGTIGKVLAIPLSDHPSIWSAPILDFYLARHHRIAV